MKKFLQYFFTPYGYKFERAGDEEWNAEAIFEFYKGSGVIWPTKNPWSFIYGGNIDIANNGLYSVEGSGYAWSSTVSRSTNQIYNTHAYENGYIYPSMRRPSFYGRSVCKK